MRTRLVTCSGDDGSVVRDAAAQRERCAGEPPAARQSCDATPACVRYSWDAEAFPACPTGCGRNASVQRRTVVCRGSDGSMLSTSPADEECGDSKPSETRACAATAACVTYRWAAEEFEPCPEDCGHEAALQSRAVTCVGSDGSVLAPEAAAAHCPEDPPVARQACEATAPCVSWAWVATPPAFPRCPTACGQNASVQERSVVCRGSTGVVTEDNTKCGATRPPNRYHSCVATAHCDVSHCCSYILRVA